MGIGEQQTSGIKDHATALTALHPWLLRPRSRGLEEAPEERILQHSRRQTGQGRPFHRAGGLQRHDSGAAAGDGIGDKGLTGKHHWLGLGRQGTKHSGNGRGEGHAARQQQRMNRQVLDQSSGAKHGNGLSWTDRTQPDRRCPAMGASEL